MPHKKPGRRTRDISKQSTRQDIRSIPSPNVKGSPPGGRRRGKAQRRKR